MKVAFGQDLEQELLDTIEQAISYLDLNVIPLECRMQGFSGIFNNEVHQMQAERLDLRRQLEELAVENSNGQDISICLEIAVQDSDGIIAERGEYIFATTNIEFTFSFRLHLRPIN